jgi:hypothetical protein
LKKILSALNKINGVERYIAIVNQVAVMYDDKEIKEEEIRKLLCKEIITTCAVPECWAIGEFSTSKLTVAAMKTLNILNKELDILIGDHESALDETVSDAEKKMLKEFNEEWTKTALKKGQKDITSIMGINPSLIAAKQVEILYDYITKNYEISTLPAPLDTSDKSRNKKDYCTEFIISKNELLLFENDLQKAKQFMIERIAGGPSSFRSIFSTLCRLANDYFGPWSRSWKVFWIKEGLLNFFRHWEGIHKPPPPPPPHLKWRRGNYRR